jgi:hypothetical protein
MSIVIGVFVAAALIIMLAGHVAGIREFRGQRRGRRST